MRVSPVSSGVDRQRQRGHEQQQNCEARESHHLPCPENSVGVEPGRRFNDRLRALHCQMAGVGSIRGCHDGRFQVFPPRIGRPAGDRMVGVEYRDRIVGVETRRL